MAPDAYTAAIQRAVLTRDEATVASIAHRMLDGERAMEILRAKGYGTTGMDLAALARLVPAATNE